MNIEKFIKDDLKVRVKLDEKWDLYVNCYDVALGLFSRIRTKNGKEYEEIRWERVKKYLGVQNSLKGKGDLPEYITQLQLQKLIQSTIRVIDDKWYELAGLKKNTVILTKEQETIGFICDCFKDVTQINLQHKVGNYKIDLYFPEYNLAIECDELGHDDRDSECEIEREGYIREKLGCDFIRFNPDSETFKISDVINRIFIKIKGGE